MGDNDRVERMDGESKTPVGLIVAGVAVVIMAIFVAQNTEDVLFEFLWFNFTIPLWLVLVGVFVLGAIVGQAAMWWRRRRRRADD
jgi:uncharacterized integral membrane protein